MIKAIIFDLDGTLADTLDDITSGLNGMLKEYGFPTVTRTQTLANINNGAFELVRRSVPEAYRGDDFVAKAKIVYEKHYASCYSDTTREYDGIHAALKTLQDQNVSLSVLSNKQDEFVKVIIQKLFPDICFSFVIGQGPFPTKPDPSSVNFIIDNLGVSKSEAALVGDSNIDMITAKNAKILPIGVEWGYRSRDILLENGAFRIVSSPKELCDVPNILI